MKILGVLLAGVISFAADFSAKSLEDVVSIIRLADGTFDVLCKDHTREVVSKQDIMSDNVCPHNPVAPPTPREKRDILFVVDNSGSMETSQLAALASAEAMIRDLQAGSVDFQIAVTTTDAYRAQFVNKPECSVFRDGPMNSACARVTGVHYSGVRIIDNFTPDIVDVFRTNFMQTISEKSLYGHGDERAFMSIQAAFANTENTNFLRADSFLHIVILSDEEDFSHPQPFLNENYDNAELIPIATMVDYLDQLTSSSSANRRYKVSAIAIFDELCRQELSTGFSRKIGRRYGELADATGGEKVSLCAPRVPYE